MVEITLEELTNRIEKLEEAVFGSGTTFTPKQKSPREYLNTVKTGTEVETLIALAYYLEVYRNVKPYGKNEIETAFREAKIPPPKNTSDTIAKNVRKGFLMLVVGTASPKTYELTSTGIDHVVKDLAKENKE